MNKKIGLTLIILGFGSIILNSIGLEFKILFWLGEGYLFKLLIGLAGLVLYLDKVTTNILPFGLQKENYKWILIGLAVNILGFVLMIGGGSADKTVFLEEEIFSHRRITLAPALVVAGYIIILYGIMKKTKTNNA